MFEIGKRAVLKLASETKLNASIGPGEEWAIPHVVNVSGGGPEAETAIQQIFALLANQPQDIRESIIRLSSVPEATRRLWLHAGSSCWREIQEDFEVFVDLRDRDGRNSISTVNSQSSRGSVFSREDQRHISACSTNTQYSDARDSYPLVGPSSPLRQGIAHQSFGGRMIQPQTHLKSQTPSGKHDVNAVEILPSSSTPEPKGPLTEGRKAIVSHKRFWCPEPHCKTGCTRKETLKNHMEDQHITWACSVCPEKMSRHGSRQQMRKHIEEQHENDPDARVLVKDRLYFGCPSCTRCLDGFDEYFIHATTEHENSNIAPKKWESTRLDSLLAHDRRILCAIEDEAIEERLDWRTMLNKLPANLRESLTKDLERGYPYLHSDGPESFVLELFNCLRGCQSSSMDWSRS